MTNSSSFIDSSIKQFRTVLMILILVVIGGVIAFIDIPKESDPDITIPFVNISMVHDGISAKDADKLLVEPIIKELKSIPGIKEINSTAAQNFGSIRIEFESDIDINEAIENTREKVDMAKPNLPDDTDEPVIEEINVALFPILVITLSGELNEKELIYIAENLQVQLESLPGVLEAKLKGNREEVAEIIIDPILMNSYNLSPEEMYQLVSRNNKLVAAGTIDTGNGRFNINVPGLVENEQDILNMPVKVSGDKVVTFKDIAYGRLTFKDPKSFARINGIKTITLEIKKRIGANIISTEEEIQRILKTSATEWPAGVNYTLEQNEASQIKTTLNNLLNNVAFATILVVLVIIATLGARSSLLVGLAIPGSFLFAILVISLMGMTLNIVILFSLILAVGMLVDGAIVVTEYADRQLVEGKSSLIAFSGASKRMAWPIIASTATTLAVFMPLLFWPDVMGKFMRYMPITILITLSASLVMALIVVPTIGAIMGKNSQHQYTEQQIQTLKIAESGDLKTLQGFTGYYVDILSKVLKHPIKALAFTCLSMILTVCIYVTFGKGSQFFPEIEPSAANINIHARGNLSIYEKDSLVREVETLILNFDEIKSVYTITHASPPRGKSGSKDLIGAIQIEFIDWNLRSPASDIIRKINNQVENIPGINTVVGIKKEGPTEGKDIQLTIQGNNYEELLSAVKKVEAVFTKEEGLQDIESTLPIPEIEWQLIIDRKEASRFNLDIASIGVIVKMVTSGLNLGSFHPDSSDEEVDIVARFPFNSRHIEQLDQLSIPLNGQSIPITHFVKRVAKQKIAEITRTNSKRNFLVKANVDKSKYLTNDKTNTLSAIINDMEFPKGITVKFQGDKEKQDNSSRFLLKAFATALFIMAIILVTQFNSFYQASLILSAVIFSTAGVLIGLLVTNQPFGIVMCGVGIISLAGIVVNNNIVLIDTYNILRKSGLAPYDAALRTGAQRLRPVLLTTVTTILGLLPMVFELNIDLINRDFAVGAPSAQWWSQLATTIAGGLTFASLLTLILTPCLLILGRDEQNPTEI